MILQPVNPYDRAKSLDLVDYLSSLGHEPRQVRNQSYWYLSPLRQEKHPSFKVNRKLNLWYDFGTGQGGSLIEFGKQYFSCSVADLFQRLEGQAVRATSPAPPVPPRNWVQPSPGSEGIRIAEQRIIRDRALLGYLRSRAIPIAIAWRFCREVEFALHGKKHIAIGFENAWGGFELRNAYFKASSSPKTISRLGGEAPRLLVFEGFFDFLSYQALLAFDNRRSKTQAANAVDYLILNSLAFFDRSREKMEGYNSIHLYLDRDQAGRLATTRALEWSPKYEDLSQNYDGFKDLNEWLCKGLQAPQLGLQIGLDR